MSDSRSKRGYDFGALSYDTIGACLDVQRQLGVHCMEVDYQHALELALHKRGLLLTGSSLPKMLASNSRLCPPILG